MTLNWFAGTHKILSSPASNVVGKQPLVVVMTSRGKNYRPFQRPTEWFTVSYDVIS